MLNSRGVDSIGIIYESDKSGKLNDFASVFINQQENSIDEERQDGLEGSNSLFGSSVDGASNDLAVNQSDLRAST